MKKFSTISASVRGPGRMSQFTYPWADPAYYHRIFIFQIFNTGCFVPVANHFGAPIIGVTTTSLYPWYSGMVGSVVTPSYIPVNLVPFTGRMTFAERAVNAAIFITLKAYYKYKYEPEVSWLAPFEKKKCRKPLSRVSARFFSASIKLFEP